jgi:hypothetical protein
MNILYIAAFKKNDHTLTKLKQEIDMLPKLESLYVIERKTLNSVSLLTILDFFGTIV